MEAIVRDKGAAGLKLITHEERSIPIPHFSYLREMALSSAAHTRSNEVQRSMPPKESVTPAEVLSFTRPTEGYLCPLDANVHGVEFLKFDIRDYDSGRAVYTSGQDAPAEPVTPHTQAEYENLVRSVRYSFPSDFLKFKTVRTSLEFKVGDKPLEQFRMIELHYFKDKVVRVYDFTFGFCIPNSVNTWEAIYDVPQYSRSEMMEYISSPFAHKSDSFYFVNNQLIMHNKAEYEYVP